MKFIETKISNLIIIEPTVFRDTRGYFLESYNQKKFEEVVGKTSFVQDNESKSYKGVLRGLHFQKPPFEQAKLVRVLKGSIIDIAVDIRINSDTYLQHRLIDLSAENFKQVYVPVGFAHGFLTLEENCEISYKVSNPYDHSSDVSISVFDDELSIQLPCTKAEITISEKDHDGLLIKALKSTII